ncbi:hypothetical protein WR25_22989 [Diploscapter pachys]|uniref:Uncharacterized protein n=1 Tax=Diploscapter pachys TaxID=2018661 RepID=A0A2A2JWB8_9BILA|nr:hypothetical protein WR25_22989 [Diploscapter pachys]
MSSAMRPVTSGPRYRKSASAFSTVTIRTTGCSLVRDERLAGTGRRAERERGLPQQAVDPVPLGRPEDAAPAGELVPREGFQHGRALGPQFRERAQRLEDRRGGIAIRDLPDEADHQRRVVAQGAGGQGVERVQFGHPDTQPSVLSSTNAVGDQSERAHQLDGEGLDHSIGLFRGVRGRPPGERVFRVPLPEATGPVQHVVEVRAEEGGVELHAVVIHVDLRE